MSRFAVVIPYFGSFKKSSVLFFESCKRCPEIDWLIVTDQSQPEGASNGDE